MSEILTDHESQIQEDLAGPFIDDDLVREILAAYGRRLQEIENCIFAVFSAYDIALDPSGSALETLANLVQVHNPEDAYTESQLRTLIRMRAVANRSHGTWGDLEEILATDSKFDAVGYQLPGGTFWLYVSTAELGNFAPTTFTRTVTDELHRASPAGSAAVYLAPSQGAIQKVEWGYDAGEVEEPDYWFNYAPASYPITSRAAAYLYQVGVE